ncbi:glycosyltransferase [Kiritimatiellaeota bacterium B1221]|nr:glycosyltransferase [Kiritimatiellaeota bacterium B1221]
MPNTLTPVSVVIPIWNAEPYLPKLLPQLFAQKGVDLQEVLLLDSMSTDRSLEIASGFPRVTIIPIACFSHGGTRNLGIQKAQSEIIVLMTQDALPQGTDWMEKLISPLQNAKVAYTFSRQVPYPGTNPMESYYLNQKFSADSSKTYEIEQEEIASLDQVFSSNVSSALKRSVALQHPFNSQLIMGEDQQFSRDVQQAGFAVQYVHDSIVIHSHNYSLMQTFRRYFDSVIAITQVFPSHKLNASASSGVSYLKHEFLFILKQHPVYLPYYFCYLGMKTLATFIAHMEKHLPRKFVRFCSMNDRYWKT